MTSIDFLESENLLFRHTATLAKKNGDLVVTNIRLMFIPSEKGEEKKVLPWASIENIEYTPPNDKRTAVRIKPVSQSEKPLIISLEGPSRKSELQNLKTIVSTLKTSKEQKASSKPQEVSPLKSNMQGNQNVSTESLKTAKTPSKLNISTIANEKDLRRNMDDAKARILNGDKKLATLYRDLVEVGKVLTDEDFWKAHSEILLQESSEQSYVNKKGKQNFLLIDLIQRDEDGNMTVNLTPEMKQLIFLRYTAVRKAFEVEVPLRYTESEFWERFFLAEVYNENSLRDDKLFGKYINEKTDGVHTFLQTAKLKKKFSHLMNKAIDLTVTMGDHSERQNPFLADLKDDGLPAPIENIAKRCNEDSFVVLAAPTNGGGDPYADTSAETLNATEHEEWNLQLNELQDAKDPSYQVLSLQKSIVSVQSSSSSVSFAQSSFGSSSSSNKKRKFEMHAEVFDILPAQELFRTATHYLPSAQTAEKLFKADLLKYAKAEILANTNRIVDSEKGMGLLSERFHQEMLEAYFQLTELLRHFYTLVNRPVIDAMSKAKAEAIINRLVNENNQTLQIKKTSISDNKAKFLSTRTEHSFDATLSVINEMQLLIQRAKHTWSSAQISFL